MTHNPKALDKPSRPTPGGKRWESIDTWLRRYDDDRDPYGRYYDIGRHPESIAYRRRKEMAA